MNKDIQRIRETVENQTGVDLHIKTRKRESVQARRMYYKILKKQTKMSLSAIGKTLKLRQDHATVLNQINKFDIDYQQDKAFALKFRSIMNVLNGVIEISEEEQLKDKNLELNVKINELLEEIKVLKEEVKYLRPKAIQPRNQQTKIYHCTEGLSNYMY